MAPAADGNLRTGDQSSLRVLHEEGTAGRRTGREDLHPEFPVHPELAREKAGHGGGDFFTSYYFAEAIRRNEPPYLDVYRGST